MEAIKQFFVNFGKNLFSNYSTPVLLETLKCMGIGMLAIFIVIAIIMLSVYLMNFIGTRAAEAKKAKEEQNNKDN